MTPRQRFMALLVLTLDPYQGGGLGHERHAIDLAECRLDVTFSRRVRLDDDRNRLSFPSALLEEMLMPQRPNSPAICAKTPGRSMTMKRR
jgi:hypothetical protein